MIEILDYLLNNLLSEEDLNLFAQHVIKSIGLCNIY